MGTKSKSSLFPRIAAHLEELITPLSEIGSPHHDAGLELAGWMSSHYRRGEVLPIVVVCTGNSRRSMLGAMMGNAAASFLNLPDVRFYSAGTTPSAFNPRTIQALQSVGFVVEATGEDATRGPDSLANPRHVVRWGTNPGQQIMEFSKALGDPTLPTSGFAALMVCDEADAGCPIVSGATARISLPFADPKIFDGGAKEGAKYAERRDDMGRLMLSVLMLVRERIASNYADQTERNQ